MFITFFVIYLSYNIKTNKMNKLNLEKVNSKKQLEAQGYCTIQLNLPYWGFLDDTDNPPKYALIVNNNSVVCFENGGDFGLLSTPCWSIKEALDIYNNGLFINM